GLYQVQAISGATFGVSGDKPSEAAFDTLIANNNFVTGVITVDKNDKLRADGIFSHIADAINAASDIVKGVGDTVKIYAGYYNEGLVNVNKSKLTIAGPNVGIAANGKRSKEADIKNTQFEVSSNDVTFDGLEFHSEGLFTGSVISADSGVTGLT